MTFSAQSLLTDIYDAWRAHDLDLLASYLPDDFSHFINIPTEMHPLGEVRHGKVAVLERFELIFQQFDTKRLETGPIAPSTHGVAIEVRTRCRHRPSGAWLEHDQVQPLDLRRRLAGEAVRALRSGPVQVLHEGR
jgi:ketosteroid isomerase-like protein